MRKIASGGMASVYLGRTIFPKDFHRVVAVKLCHPHLVEDPKFRDMLLQEAQLAARIRHPNVVQTIDVGVEDELYLVMDFVDGASLAELVKRAELQGERLPLHVIAAILTDTLRGLEAAHAATDPAGAPLGVIHRDISPQNLLVGRDGITRIADFGVAKATQGNPVTTKTGEVKGKLSYISPEQLSTTDTLTSKVDIFAIGIVAWELIEGDRLFTGDTYADTVQRVLYVPIPPFESSEALAYPLFIEAVESALVRDPNERIASARALLDKIEGSGVPIATRAQVSACVETLLGKPALIAEEVLATAVYDDARNRAAKRRRQLGLAGVAVAALGIGGVFGIRALEQGPREAELKGDGPKAVSAENVVGSMTDAQGNTMFHNDAFEIRPLPERGTPDAHVTGDTSSLQDAGTPAVQGAQKSPEATTKRRIRRRARPRRTQPTRKPKTSQIYDPETI